MNFKNHLSSYSTVFMTSLRSKTLHDKLSFKGCGGFRIVRKLKKKIILDNKSSTIKETGRKVRGNIITAALQEYACWKSVWG